MNNEFNIRVDAPLNKEFIEQGLRVSNDDSFRGPKGALPSVLVALGSTVRR